MKLYVVRKSAIGHYGSMVFETVAVHSDVDRAYEEKHVRSRTDTAHFYSVLSREVDVDSWFPAEATSYA